MYRNNEVKDGLGQLTGYRCDVCDQIKSKMWGCICNECRAKQEAAKYGPSQRDIELFRAAKGFNK